MDPPATDTATDTSSICALRSESVVSDERCRHCHAWNKNDSTAAFCDQCGHRLSRGTRKDKSTGTKKRRRQRNGQPPQQDRVDHVSSSETVAVTTATDGSGWFWGSELEKKQSVHDGSTTERWEAQDLCGQPDTLAATSVRLGDKKHILQKSATSAHGVVTLERSPLRRAKSYSGGASVLPPLTDLSFKPTSHHKDDSSSTSLLWGSVLSNAIDEFESKQIILTAEIDADANCMSVLAQKLRIENANRSKFVVTRGVSQLQEKHDQLAKKIRSNKEKLILVHQRLAALYGQQQTGRAETCTKQEEEPHEEHVLTMTTKDDTGTGDGQSVAATVFDNQDEHVLEDVKEDPPTSIKKYTSKKKKKKTKKNSKKGEDEEDDERRALTAAVIRIQKRFRVVRARKLFAEMVKRAYDRVLDPDSKQYFYYNPRTMQSQWEVPPALAKVHESELLQHKKRLQNRTEKYPSILSLEAAAIKIQSLFRRRFARKAMAKMLQQVYEKVYDADSGSYYYYSTKTKTSSWEKPKLLQENDLIPGIPSIPPTAQVVQEDQPQKTAAASKIQKLFRTRATRFFLKDLVNGKIEKHYDADVQAWYYFNHRTQQSFWEQPRHAELAKANGETFGGSTIEV